MYDVRPTKKSTYEASRGLLLFAALIILMAMLTGCANTVVKLTSMCHAEQRAVISSFNGDSGRVECR